jgi:hypothetical protein
MQLKDRDMKYLPIILKEFKIRYRKGDWKWVEVRQII